MTDYSADFAEEAVYGGVSTNAPDVWHSDDDAATTLSIDLDASGGWNFSLAADLTVIPGIVGWRLEADVVSGSGQLFWECSFDADTLGYFAFDAILEVDGPGTVAYEMTDPYFVASIGPGYSGIYDVLQRIANDSGYLHAYGSLEALYEVGVPPVVLSGFRVVFYTQDLACTTEEFNDGELGEEVTVDNTILSDAYGFVFGTDDGSGTVADGNLGGSMTLAASTSYADIRGSLAFKPEVGEGGVLANFPILRWWTGIGDLAEASFALKYQAIESASPKFIAYDLSSEYEHTIGGTVSQWWLLTATLHGDRVQFTIHDEAGTLEWAPPSMAASGLQVSAISTTSQPEDVVTDWSLVDTMRLCIPAVLRRPRLRNYPTDVGRNYPGDRFRRNVGRQP